MKLGGVRDNTVYAHRDRQIGTWTKQGGFQPRGTIPNPATGIDAVSFAARNAKTARSLLQPFVGAYTTGNVWPIGQSALLATNQQWVFQSADNGLTWEPVHRLPESSGPMGTLPTACAVHDDVLYLAEYPLHSAPARIVRSTDQGCTWEPYITEPESCHFHGVYVDPYSDTLWATTGDADHTSAIGIIENGEFHVVGHGSQRWRAVDLAFTPTSIIWGMDAPFADRKEILRLRRRQINQTNPIPDVLTHIDQAVFYTATTTVDDTEWVFLSTAAETIAGTAMDHPENHAHSPVARVIAASSASDFRDWHIISTFRRRPALAGLTKRFPSAGAYVFLATAPSGEILINPFNTVSHHGTILQAEIPRTEIETEQTPLLEVMQ